MTEAALKALDGRGLVFECKECQYKGDIWQVVQHMLKKHTKEEDVPYLCKKCGGRYGTKNSAKRHLRVKHIGAAWSEVVGTKVEYNLKSKDVRVLSSEESKNYYKARARSGEATAKPAKEMAEKQLMNALLEKVPRERLLAMLQESKLTANPPSGQPQPQPSTSAEECLGGVSDSSSSSSSSEESSSESDSESDSESADQPQMVDTPTIEVVGETVLQCHPPKEDEGLFPPERATGETVGRRHGLSNSSDSSQRVKSLMPPSTVESTSEQQRPAANEVASILATSLEALKESFAQSISPLVDVMGNTMGAHQAVAGAIKELGRQVGRLVDRTDRQLDAMSELTRVLRRVDLPSGARELAESAASRKRSSSSRAKTPEKRRHTVSRLPPKSLDEVRKGQIWKYYAKGHRV